MTKSKRQKKPPEGTGGGDKTEASGELNSYLYFKYIPKYRYLGQIYRMLSVACTIGKPALIRSLEDLAALERWRAEGSQGVLM